MYDFISGLVLILALGCIACFGIYFYRSYLAKEPIRQQEIVRQKFASAPTIHDENELPARESNQATMKALGMPTVKASNLIRNIPTIDPEQEGSLTQDQEVITSSRIRALSPTGVKNIDFFETSGGYALFVKGGKAFLLKEHSLTFAESEYLSDQRIALIERNDNVIEDFGGHCWNIKGAMGDFQGEKSKIQVLSVNKEIGSAKMVSALSPDLFDLQTATYYDIEAINADTGQVMVAMFVNDTWNCFIGRQLEAVEIASLQGI